MDLEDEKIVEYRDGESPVLAGDEIDEELQVHAPDEVIVINSSPDNDLLLFRPRNGAFHGVFVG